MDKAHSGQSSPPQPNKFKHKKLALVLIIFALISFIYSLVLPLGEAADEFEHFALIRFIAEEQRPPLTTAEKTAIGAKGDASPIYHMLVALLTQHVDVSNLPELPDPRHKLQRAIPHDKLPFKGLYHTEDETYPFQGIVLAWHSARLVSIPLTIILIITIYATVLTIYPQKENLALTAAIFAAFIPRLVISSAIISDDNLVIPLIALALYVLVKIIQGDTRNRTFIFLGILMGLAAITKYHSLLLLPETTVALIILAWAKQWGWQQWLRRWGLTILGFLLTAVWWFAYLFFQFNQIEKLGWIRGIVATLGDPVIANSVDRTVNAEAGVQLTYEAELSWFEWLALLFKTFWFRYGRGHIIDDALVNWGLAIVTLVAITSLIIFVIRRWQTFKTHFKTRSLDTRWLAIGVLAFHFFTYFSIVVIRYLTLPTRETAQARHLYPALIAIAFFFVLGISVLPTIFNRQRTEHFNRLMPLGLGLIMIGFVVLTLLRYITPVYYPYLPITTLAPQPSIQYPLEQTLTDGITLKGFSLPAPQTKAGDALPIALYWSTDKVHTRDHLVEICLYDASDQPAICHQHHPADGRYPTRAWEEDYLTRDDVYVPIPACLSPGTYSIELSIRPLKPNIAATSVDESNISLISLEKIILTSSSQASSSNIEIWTNGKFHQKESVSLPQLRQALTVIDYAPPRQIYFSSGSSTWKSIEPGRNYTCANDATMTVYNFIVDATVQPTPYQLMVDDERLDAPQITVETRQRNFDPPQNMDYPLNAAFADQVELLGYNLDTSPYQPGDTVTIELFWQSLNTMPQRYVGSFHLLDNAMTMRGQIDHVLGADFEYPNVLWAPGETITQPFLLPIGQKTPPGLYTLEFGVYYNDSGNFNFLPVTLPDNPELHKQLNLAQIRITDAAHEKSPDHSVVVNVGDEVRFLGFDVSPGNPAAGQSIQLALHWQAVTQPTTNYTVFTQLIGPDGMVWAQQDNMPQQGRYPTTNWTAPDKVIDRYELMLPNHAPPGEYRLLAGMYNLETGQRLPAVNSDGTPLPDNAVMLTTFTLPPK